jgi:hypothetical protein
MPLLPSSLPKDIVTPDGSIKFTQNGIVIGHPTGSQIVIGPNGIEITAGGTTLKVSLNDIILSAYASNLKLAQNECAMSTGGPMRLNGAFVNVNNNALEVF